MALGQNGASDKRLLSQINVTPLVDVMLVLLIIFMVTAPMMQSGIDVKLPKTEGAAIKAREEPLVVTIDSRRRVYLGDRLVQGSELKSKLEAITKTRADATVLLRADETVPYGFVVSAMASIRRAGIEKIGMVTEPVSGAGR